MVLLHIGLQACEERTQIVVFLGICRRPSLLVPLAPVHLAWISERSTPLPSSSRPRANMFAALSQM
jgi:hypothetical protein